MTEFEKRLSECLEALSEGRWDIDECLRRYPKHAAGLRPHLLAASSVIRAYDASPREEFSAAARERFLIASGQRLAEAYDTEPEPSFFAAARVRFLMAAHRVKRAERPRAPRIVTFAERHFRSLATAAAVLVLFLSFSAYTVASANSALPGDWQYPVKLQTERVRLALAFGDDAKRGVRLSIAEERAREIEALARQRRPISASVINRLVEQTKPLINDAGNDWDTDDLARLQTVAEREKAALQQAQPQVDPAAQSELTAAVQVTLQGVTVSDQLLATRDDRPPAVVTPNVPVSALDATATPTPTAIVGSDATPGTSATPSDSSTPGTTPTAIPTGEIIVNPSPETVRDEINWIRIVAGNISTLVPSSADGWVIQGINGEQGVASPSPTLVKLSNTNGTALMTLNTRNGDMYWFIAHGTKFDEVQMRIQQPDGQVLIADTDYLHAVYGADADVPIFVLANLTVKPAAEAPPEATPSSVGTDSATPAP
jgi:hypothetical protein